MNKTKELKAEIVKRITAVEESLFMVRAYMRTTVAMNEDEKYEKRSDARVQKILDVLNDDNNQEEANYWRMVAYKLTLQIISHEYSLIGKKNKSILESIDDEVNQDVLNGFIKIMETFKKQSGD